MSIESKHPDFIEVSDDYRVMRDTFAGERRIKEGTFAYLPPTGGQIADGAIINITSSGWQKDQPGRQRRRPSNTGPLAGWQAVQEQVRKFESRAVVDRS